MKKEFQIGKPSVKDKGYDRMNDKWVSQNMAGRESNVPARVQEPWSY